MTNNKENIIVGDLHSCRLEFNQLLEKIKYDSKKHRLILVGDILDRGPDPIGLLHQIQDMSLESVMGNHEEKVIRWYKHETLKKVAGVENPVQVSNERRKEWESLSKSDIEWLINLPFKIHIKDNWYVVHAGLEPHIPFDSQDIERIIRIRYVNADGSIAKLKRNREVPAGAIFWAEKWEQSYNIVFGHHRFKEPTVFKKKSNVCVAIDTGCVYGNALTAYNVDRNEFTQVKANKIYYQS